MTTGVLYLVCRVRTDGGASVAPCLADPATGAGTYPELAQGALLDPATADLITAAAHPVDWAQLGQVFALAFGGTVGLWATAVGVGAVLGHLRPRGVRR